MGSDRRRRTVSSFGAQAATSGLTRRLSTSGGTARTRSPGTSTSHVLAGSVAAPRSVVALFGIAPRVSFRTSPSVRCSFSTRVRR